MAINNSILSILGLFLSAYSVYVEHRVEQNLHDDNNPDDEFRALCDIDAIGASCSAVFQLPEGKMLSFFGLVQKDSFLDIPNGILGVLFYLYVFIRCNYLRESKIILLDSRVNAVICTLAMASSLFLARKLYIIKEICVVCLTTHLINTTLFCRAVLEVTRRRKDKIT